MPRKCGLAVIQTRQLIPFKCEMFLTGLEIKKVTGPSLLVPIPIAGAGPAISISSEARGNPVYLTPSTCDTLPRHRSETRGER